MQGSDTIVKHRYIGNAKIRRVYKFMIPVKKEGGYASQFRFLFCRQPTKLRPTALAFAQNKTDGEIVSSQGGLQDAIER